MQQAHLLTRDILAFLHTYAALLNKEQQAALRQGVRVIEEQVARQIGHEYLEAIMTVVQREFDRQQKEVIERLTTLEGYRQFAATARHFIQMFQLYLNPARVSRLEKSLAELLAQIEQNSPDGVIRRCVEQTKQEWQTLTAMLILQEVQGKTAVPAIKRLIYQAHHHWQHPQLIQIWRQKLQTALTETTILIRQLLRHYPPETRSSLLHELRQMACSLPTTYLCLILLIDDPWGSNFYQEMPLFPAKNTLEFHLYGGVILSQLTQLAASQEMRHKAAQDTIHFLAGTNCLFLVEYLAQETNPDIAQQLQHGLETIRPDKRLLYFRQISEPLRHTLLRHRTTRHLLRRDILFALQPTTNATLQLLALETIQQNELYPYSILLPLLLRPFSDTVKLKMVAMLRRTAQENPITTLFRAVAHSSPLVQPALLTLLHNGRSRMTTLERGLYLLTYQAVHQQKPLNTVGRLFVQLFARSNPAYQSIAEWLLALKELPT